MILINEEFEKTGKDVSVPVDNIEDGEQIAAQLLKELAKSKTGVGLAAPQIGINKRVVAVNVNYPLYFINPNEIIDPSCETPMRLVSIVPLRLPGSSVYL